MTMRTLRGPLLTSSARPSDVCMATIPKAPMPWKQSEDEQGMHIVNVNFYQSKMFPLNIGVLVWSVLTSQFCYIYEKLVNYAYVSF